MRTAVGGESFFSGTFLFPERIGEAAVSAVIGCENDDCVFSKIMHLKRVNDFANELVGVESHVSKVS